MHEEITISLDVAGDMDYENLAALYSQEQFSSPSVLADYFSVGLVRKEQILTQLLTRKCLTLNCLFSISVVARARFVLCCDCTGTYSSDPFITLVFLGSHNMISQALASRAAQGNLEEFRRRSKEWSLS